MDPALSLERFAALSAELDAGEPRDKVLSREGVALEAWNTSQETWLAKLAAEVSCNRFELTNRYNAAFMKRRQALEDMAKANKKKSGRKGEAKKSAPVGEEMKAAVGPEVAPAQPVVRGPAAEVPSFLKEAPMQPPTAPANVPSFLRDAPVQPPPPVPANVPSFLKDAAAQPPPTAPANVPSFLKDAAVQPPPTAPANVPSFLKEAAVQALPLVQPVAATPALKPEVASPPARVMGPLITPSTPEIRVAPTADAMNQTLPASGIQSPWPFADKDGARQVGSPGVPFMPINRVADSLKGDTQPVKEGRRAAALPFRQADQSPPAAVVSEPKKAADPLNETVLAHESPLRAALPFVNESRGQANAPQVKEAGAKGGGLPFKPAAQATPPRAAQPPPVAHVEPRLTLEQFASLAAEIAQNPAGIAQVRARYHLSESDHVGESAAWQRRFAGDKELFARYSSLFQRYRDWLSRTKR